MLIELAIGDAYGVGFEFRKEGFVAQYNQLEKYYPHERYSSLYKRYSDDTQMSIALAELMLEDINWTPTNIANKFVEVFQRDVRPGYSSRMYNALAASKDGNEFLTLIDNNSKGSGAAMRSGVIGLLKFEEEVLEKASIQASLTHNTKSAIVSAQLVALATHYFAYGLGPKQGLEEYLERFISIDWLEDWEAPVSAKGDVCVKAAITALKRNNNMANLLQDCIAFCGDVDTVAAIALGMAAFSSEMDQNLSKWMYEELENENYGKDYLLDLDQKLYHKYKIVKSKTS
ncbi:MAG: hypothetical protein Sapg2KO_04850 [Saprospiraceae bacterium]